MFKSDVVTVTKLNGKWLHDNFTTTGAFVCITDQEIRFQHSNEVIGFIPIKGTSVRMEKTSILKSQYLLFQYRKERYKIGDNGDASSLQAITTVLKAIGINVIL